MTLRTVTATRYVTPLREGGSLPAIVEADDDGLYVLKFRGAGQGTKALAAELLSGELARIAGLRVPDIVFITLDPELARTEPDPEIQDLIRASAGCNLGVDYLPGSVTFDPLADAVDEDLASRIVWFDAFVTNVDRTPRNTNMLVWHKQLWLIDHGASLIVSHSWANALERSRDPFPHIRDHVLLPRAGALRDADAILGALLTADAIRHVADAIPDDWLDGDATFPDSESHRGAYVEYLVRRLDAPRAFVEEAIRARS